MQPDLVITGEYLLFLDETGDHSLTSIDISFPYFLLCGVLIEKKQYLQFCEEILVFKEYFFKRTEVVLHSRDIRKCDKDFSILFDLSVKELFYKKINTIIEKTDFHLIASCIRKQEYVEKFGRSGLNPYQIGLSTIIEQLAEYMKGIVSGKVQIIAEMRGKNEDTNLIQYYNMLRDRGTLHIGGDELQSYIRDFQFRNKRDNDPGIQLADLCAYPLIQSIISPAKQNISFDLIKNKLVSLGKQYGTYNFPVFP